MTKPDDFLTRTERGLILLRLHAPAHLGLSLNSLGRAAVRGGGEVAFHVLVNTPPNTDWSIPEAEARQLQADKGFGRTTLVGLAREGELPDLFFVWDLEALIPHEGQPGRTGYYRLNVEVARRHGHMILTAAEVKDRYGY